MNFLDNVLASKNPSATNMISQISRRSGTTIAHGRNNAFKFSGNSALPAYPGFMVMKIPTVGVNGISSPIKSKIFLSSLIASWILFTWTAITERTSTVIRLNSSKHPQAPVCASPWKYHNVFFHLTYMDFKSIWTILYLQFSIELKPCKCCHKIYNPFVQSNWIHRPSFLKLFQDLLSSPSFQFQQVRLVSLPWPNEGFVWE